MKIIGLTLVITSGLLAEYLYINNHNFGATLTFISALIITLLVYWSIRK